MVNEVVLDHQREQRLGFSEAIYSEGKSIGQIEKIISDTVRNKQSLLFTRLNKYRYDSIADNIKCHLNYDDVSRTAYVGDEKKISDNEKVIAVITAGTSDIPVAKEAVRSLNFYGYAAEEIYDVGVAGLWRLLSRIDTIKNMQVFIVVAGMDAALASVFAGLVPGLVVAVPSSHGYGVADNGQVALNSMLASCAPGLVVVNIDNGYGAACAVIRSINSP